MRAITGKRSDAVFCRWRLRLTRPAEMGFVGPVSATPPGDLTEAGAWRSGNHTLNRAPSLPRVSGAVPASASSAFQTLIACRRAHSTGHHETSLTSASSAPDCGHARRHGRLTGVQDLVPASPVNRQFHNKQRRWMSFGENKAHRPVVSQRQPA